MLLFFGADTSVHTRRRSTQRPRCDGAPPKHGNRYAASLASRRSSLFVGMRPTLQEPWFFTRHGDCIHPNSSALWGCDQQAQQRYLVGTLHRDVVVASGLTRAAFEASPDYILVRKLPGLSLSACCCGICSAHEAVRCTKLFGLLLPAAAPLGAGFSCCGGGHLA